jgi:hypothetical protein
MASGIGLPTMLLSPKQWLTIPKRPVTGIVGVKGDGDAAHRGHEDGIAHGACERGIVYRDHLEGMAVKMHRVRQKKNVENAAPG